MKARHLLLVSLLMLSSCRTINYTDKSGNSLKITSFMWDSSIGEMTASNGQDSLTVKNYNSSPDKQAMQMVSDLVKSGAIAGTVATKYPATRPSNSQVPSWHSED